MIRPPSEGNMLNWRWGFVIVLSKFVLLVFDGGIAKSFGVLLHEMVVRLNSDYAIIGFICSLPSTLTLLASPLVSIILERMNGRLVAGGGALLSSVCLLMCAFSSNVVVVGVGLALTGTGFSCIFLPTTLLINDYFPDDFVMMNTLALYGLTTGATFIPFIVERSQEAYGYHGSFLILASMCFNVMVCAAVIRKPIMKKSKSLCPGAQTTGLVRTDSEITCNQFRLIRRKHNTMESSVHVTPTECQERTPDDDDASTILLRGEEIPSQENQSSSTGYDHLEIELDDVDTAVTTEHSPLIIEEDDEVDGPSAGTTKDEPSEFCCSGLTLTDCLFFLNIPAIYLTSYALYGWMLFLVPHAESLGILSAHAVVLSSIAGIGGIFGRTGFIILVAKNVDPFLIYIPIGTVCTLTFLLDFIGSGYPIRAGLAFIQGFCFFTEDTMAFAMVKKTVLDPVKFRRASAMVFFVSGLGATSAGYITGFLFDLTQSYTQLFMVFGVLHFVALVIWTITVVLLRNQSKITTKGSM